LPGTAAAQAGVLTVAGELNAILGDYPTAIARYDAALDLWEAIGDHAGMARALGGLGSCAQEQSNLQRAALLHERALRAARNADADREIASALANLAIVAYYQGRLDDAVALWDEALVVVRDLGDELASSALLDNVGAVALLQGDLDRTLAYREEAVATARRLGSPHRIGASLVNLGGVLQRQGDLDAAAAHSRDGLALLREIGDLRAQAIAHFNLAGIARDRGEIGSAAASLVAALDCAIQVGDREKIAHCLEGIAALPSDRSLTAARLFGAADALWAAIGTDQHEVDDPQARDRRLSALRADLGAEALEEALATGRTLPVASATTEARVLAAGLEMMPATSAPSPATVFEQPRLGVLSPREREVLALLTQGWTDAQIAASLGISHRTAATHVSHILTKFGVTSRSGIVAYAFQHGYV
jgi:non-specific serine/threonine protein kinase